jgi:hypothetical protein
MGEPPLNVKKVTPLGEKAVDCFVRSANLQAATVVRKHLNAVKVRDALLPVGRFDASFLSLHRDHIGIYTHSM